MAELKFDGRSYVFADPGMRISDAPLMRTQFVSNAFSDLLIVCSTALATASAVANNLFEYQAPPLLRYGVPILVGGILGLSYLLRRHASQISE